YGFSVDSITATSFRVSVGVKTNGFPCAIHFTWGPVSYINPGQSEIFSVQSSVRDTIVAKTIEGLNPLTTYYVHAIASDSIYPLVEASISKGPFQTTYDSKAVGLTIPITVAPAGWPFPHYLNIGVNTNANICYDLGLGELPEPPAAPD